LLTVGTVFASWTVSNGWAGCWVTTGNGEATNENPYIDGYFQRYRCGFLAPGSRRAAQTGSLIAAARTAETAALVPPLLPHELYCHMSGRWSRQRATRDQCAS
jgi:hypothetical protein